MGPKTQAIIAMAAANPHMTHAEIAEALGSTSGSVKVILCRARKAGTIGKRAADNKIFPRSGTIGKRAADNKIFPRWCPINFRRRYEDLRGTMRHELVRAVIESEAERAHEPAGGA